MRTATIVSFVLLFLTVFSSLILINGLIPPAAAALETDHSIQITPTGCPNATNCASGNYPTESSFFLPFTQQKLFQNPRPTSRQDYYVFYRQNMSIPGSGCSGGAGPDFCDECVYAYSSDGVGWRVNQTIGLGLGGIGNFYHNCSATYFDNTANNQLVVYLVVARNAATAKLGHNIEFVIGTVADTADPIAWGTVQTVSSSSSTQNFQFPVLQVDPSGYIQIAYSWVDTSVNRQTVDLCSSLTRYPTSNPQWKCNGGGNNSLFNAATQLGQTDASFMPQLQPISGRGVLVLQGPCSNISTSACEGPTPLTENATLVDWNGITQAFTPTATFTYSAQSPSDRRSSTSDPTTGTFYVAYENGTDGKFWTRHLAKPYTSWTSPTRITSDDGEGRILLLSGSGTAKTLAFVEATDKPLFVSGGGGSGTCGTCPQIKMYNATTNGTVWSSATTFYSNTTWAAAWSSTPWIVNTTTTSRLPVIWEQHDCGFSTNVQCTTQPEELWFDSHVLFTQTIPPPKATFAITTTFDGRIFKYLQNGSLIVVAKPVGSALRQVAWKPDGSYALIVGDQGVVYRYDGTTLVRFSSPVIGNTNLNTVAWKPDGSFALMGGQNGFLFQYNGTAATKITDPTNRNIFSISWNPNGNLALIVGEGGTALLYTVPSKITVLNTGIGQQLFSAAWNPNGSYALVGGENGLVLSFNGTKFKTISPAGAPGAHNVRFIGFNPAGTTGLLVGDGGQVWTYNGTKLSSISSGTNNNLFSLSWLGSRAYIVGQNGTLFAYAAGTLTKLSSGTNANFSSIAWQSQPLSVKFTFSPSNPTVQAPVSFSASATGGIAPYGFSWNFGDGASGRGNSVAHSYSSPGSYDVTVTVADTAGSISQTSSTVTVQPPAPPVVAVSNPSPNPASTGATVNLSFSVSSSISTTGVTVNWGDGTAIDNLAGTATSDSHSYAKAGNYTITIVTTDNSGSTSQATASITVTAHTIVPSYALAITNDGKVYKTYANGTMVLIGQPVTTALRAVSWKPDGSYALISGDSAVLLKYDGTQLTIVNTGISTGFNFWSVSWKPDGSYALVTGTSGLLFKFDGSTVTMINDPNTLTIFAVSWNPTGNYALLVGKTGRTLIYDGTLVRSFANVTTNDLDAIAWNPNGQYALIGGLGGTILRFNGTQVTALTANGIAGTNEIRSIAFNPLGTLALLVGDNGMVLTYNGSTFTLLAQATFSWLYGVSWAPNGTAFIVGNSGNELTYTNGTLTKLSNVPAFNFRAIAWKP